MAKKGPKFSAAAAFNAAPDDESMGQGDPSQGAAPGGPPAPGDTDDTSSSSGQPLTLPAEQVAQMEQLKQSGDFAGLGQYVAQFLP